MNSEQIISSSVLTTMIYAQHTQLMGHSNLLFKLAVISVFATITVYIAAAFCAFILPAAFPLMLALLTGSPFSIVSGSILFWQYKKRQAEAFELCSRLAAETRRESAIAVSLSISEKSKRDAAQTQLALQLVK